MSPIQTAVAQEPDRARDRLLEEGRTALREGAWEAARERFEHLVSCEPRDAEGWEGLAQANYWLQDPVRAMDARQAAYQGYRARGDTLSAGRLASWLASDFLALRGEPVVAAGWQERARELLDGLEPTVEHARLRALDAHIALSVDNDPAAARAAASEAGEIARRIGDLDHQMQARAMEGLSRAVVGDVAEGMRLLESAAQPADKLHPAKAAPPDGATARGPASGRPGAQQPAGRGVPLRQRSYRPPTSRQQLREAGSLLARGRRRSGPSLRPPLIRRFRSALWNGSDPRLRLARIRAHAQGEEDQMNFPVRRVPAMAGSMLGGLLVAAAALAQQPHDHTRHGHGGVDFPVSCRPEVQGEFDAAVAVLHSFGYEEARNAFDAIARRDPACGMAHWGVAMTYYHPQWAPPSPEELAAGRAAAERARTVGAGTERERAYIDAVGAFYGSADRRDHPTRARAYAAAMEQLSSRYPEDAEAKIFHALAILGAAPPNDPTYVAQKRAADILTGLLPEHPRHPGIAHYTIHAFDYPALAELALPAARTYASLAPESPHALHMPSHIFTRLGLWREAIDSNLACASVAREQVARTHPGAAGFEVIHCLDYIAYAHLQLGEDERAHEVLEEVRRARRFDEPNMAVGYAVLAVPARYALERGDWRAAADLSIPPLEIPWERYPEVRSLTYLANAIGAARAGNPDAARRAVRQLEELHEELEKAPPAGPYDWAGHVDAMRLAAAAWLAQADNRSDEAVRSMTAAAEKDELVGKHAVTPGPLLPPREMLGDLLLELDRPEEALAAYETSLADSPGRFNGLLGAARAARSAGHAERAASHYRALLELAGSSSRQSAVAEARAYLAESYRP